jgi:predicted esterase
MGCPRSTRVWKPPALVGWSNGAIVAMHVAQIKAAPLSHVVMFGFTPTPELEAPRGSAAKSRAENAQTPPTPRAVTSSRRP